MSRTRISVKNLRVFGQRIPDGIFRKIASDLLPGADPTPNELKNGAPSKAQVLASLCETDKTWRSKTTKAAMVEMSKDAKTAAAKAGWIAPGESSTAIAEYRSLWESIEQHDIARDGRSTLTGALHDPSNESLLAMQLRGAASLPDGTLEERVAALKNLGKPAIMACNFCGKFPATERQGGGWYCERHIQNGAASAPSMPAPYGNLVTPELSNRLAPVYEPMRTAAPVPVSRRGDNVADFPPLRSMQGWGN